MLLDGDGLTRFRQGDRRVLAEVYRQHVSSVAGFLRNGFSYTSRDRARRFGGYARPFELENALQETFARAFRPAARLAYDGLRPYRSYLYAIARNVALDELRQRDPLARLDDAAAQRLDDYTADDDAPLAAPSPSLSAEQELLRGELARLYADFIGALTSREAAFFLARFGEQQSRRQSGQSCCLTPMQTRTLERRLRQRFLQFLQSHGYLESYAGETACGVLRAV